MYETTASAPHISSLALYCQESLNNKKWNYTLLHIQQRKVQFHSFTLICSSPKRIALMNITVVIVTKSKEEMLIFCSLCQFFPNILESVDIPVLSVSRAIIQYCHFQFHFHDYFPCHLFWVICFLYVCVCLCFQLSVINC